ncbi:LRAT-like domain [Macleaya cordata]|uniref:LRAT-like domain n=1 Tax=Macleaya cordata TaxID=56857 RepID=A0A200R1I0_MACCD|nr:LRAT-like domain [Macleaya cordata]
MLVFCCYPIFMTKPHHWKSQLGIYTGEGKVIHFTRGAGQEIGTGTVLDRIIFSSSHSDLGTPCQRCGDQSTLDGVICSCLDCFLSGGDLYLFQYGVSTAFFLAKARGGTCTLATCDPPMDVLHRASYLLQNGFGVYHIFKNNCEDFAIYCKTGLLVVTSISVGRSGQASSFLAAASAIISSPLRFLTTSFTGLSAVAGGMYCISRFVSDIGVRRDVAKVSVESLVASSGRHIDEVEATRMSPTAIEVRNGSARATEIPTEFATAGTFHGEIHNTLGWDAKYEEMQITLTVGCLSAIKCIFYAFSDRQSRTEEKRREENRSARLDTIFSYLPTSRQPHRLDLFFKPVGLGVDELFSLWWWSKWRQFTSSSLRSLAWLEPLLWQCFTSIDTS